MEAVSVMLPPNRTITGLAAPRVTLPLTLGVVGVGTMILLPSFVCVFRVVNTREGGE